MSAVPGSLSAPHSPSAYQVTRLPGGLTVATASMPHMTSVSLGLWVGVGGRYESAQMNGASHFIEHLLFKGTRRRSARDISQAVEGIGGYLNAFTSEEHTCIYSKALHHRLPELLDVLADMFLNSQFAPAEIRKERSVIKDEATMYRDQPQHHVQELLNDMMWPRHPLGRPLTGTLRTISRMTRSGLLEYLRGNYVTGATVIAAAGHLDHAELVAAVSRIAPRFARGSRPGFDPAVTRQVGPRIRLHTRKTEQTQIALGIRACSRHDERRHALRMLNTILGENMSSRLFQVVREDLGLVYSIYSSPSFFEDTGSVTISAGLDTQHLRRVTHLVMRELRRLREDLVAAAELRRARDYLLGQFDLSLESTENQMMWVGEQWLGYATVVRPAEVRERIARVAASEIRQAARDFFRPEALSLALVSPVKTVHRLQPLLAG